MSLLSGVTVVELAGLAPVPFAGMILSDAGAQVIRVDRTGIKSTTDVLGRGKLSVQLNLKSPTGVGLLKRMLKTADVLLDPYRPGVLEKMGLDPQMLVKENPRLVVCRLTGFGQEGPYASMAGHDMNYVAVTGVLSILGRSDQPPTFPGNLLGDFAGGSCFAVIGILLALLERHKSGKGQIIDANMAHGVAYLSSFIFKMRQEGLWNAGRGKNLLDTGAPFYDTYETKDGKWMSVGSLEPQFFKILVQKLQIQVPAQMDMEQWPVLKSKLKDVFLTKTQKEWQSIFDGSDACVVPVVEIDECHTFEPNQKNKIFLESKDGIEPRACPNFSRTPMATVTQQPRVGEHTQQVLEKLGLSKSEIETLEKNSVISKL
ncbi:alpha-methylacyl-CoA racemase-like protein [Gorgonomyces haynaldii]|nr:alpha-methylacyl-CoA racemase-like protein [Gorgonomyces haynaldii]